MAQVLLEEKRIAPDHVPVLLTQTLAALSPRAGGRYLDGTVGLGGHSAALLAAAPDIEVCGLDRDEDALAVARERLAAYGRRVHLFHSRYSGFAAALKELGWAKIDGALLDVGVSSLQLDENERGFSFLSDGPLDMRMDRNSGEKSAWHWVNRENFVRLKECIATLGEDPQAGRIARFIVEARQKAPINSTAELACLVEKAYPPAWRRKARRHPATRTFQALRMAINDELGELEHFLKDILAWLPVGGRLVIITFHSLEDRLVKHAVRRWAEGCRCVGQGPVCVCGHQPEVRNLYKKPLQADAVELAANPRASSAKLRAVEKTADYAPPGNTSAQGHHNSGSRT
ncbi:MAG: 16S rRNA (cytosine(1402)-N(4))-methyltransferase RsmH [Desulfovibrio sp.]|jgi:16S rRNA (cytosine1402-N4)-methyltransferase|nr:16S rRNA (cytosine(1402)-N(4))-methyltransferase RsmH [Desulfovibrio sp.]